MNVQREIRKIVKKIVKKYNPEKIILFGSFAWGKPSPSSDIDLLIIKNSSLPKRFRTTRVERALDIPPLPVDIMVRTPQEIEKRKKMGDFFVKLVLDKGKVLYAKK